MGILDDAIRDHLDLKRRRGTDEPEIKRLEDEAFGPAGRPDASGTLGATASAVASPPAESPPAPDTSEGLELESPLDAPAAEPPAAETPPPDGPAPETPPAPQPEVTPEATPDEGGDAGETPQAEGEIAFHDFAAEEGLVGTSKQPNVELGEPAAQPHEDEAPISGSDDTQVHDMAKELGLGDREEGPATPEKERTSETGGEGEPTLGELDMDELDLELEDEQLERPGDVGDAEVNGSGEPPEPAGSAEVVEETAEVETVEPARDEPEEGEDVLEETPDFLRDAPESDRLWFEQGKPKDFDFDEDE
jgi:hypothetical protein